MDFTTPKVVCGVCHGKGGFRKLKNNFLDSNWTDCPYCEGYGFTDDKTTEEECRTELLYNRYRNNLELEMQLLGTVKVCNLDYVKIDPSDRRKWTAFMKHLMKFAYHNEKVNVNIKHAFEYEEIEGKEELITFWELSISINELKDIEGLIDLVKFYNDTVRR